MIPNSYPKLAHEALAAGKTHKVMVLDSGYTPNKDTDEYIDDVSSNEIAASGDYTTGGVAIANPAVTVDTGADKATFDGDDVALTGVDATNAQHAVEYRCTLTDKLRSEFPGFIFQAGSPGDDNSMGRHVPLEPFESVYFQYDGSGYKKIKP